MAESRCRGVAAASRAAWLLQLLLPWLLLETLQTPARAAVACNPWPSDSAGTDDLEECRRCLGRRGVNVTSADQVEIVWNRTHRTLEGVPPETCKLWAEHRSITALSALAFARAPCLRRVFLEANAIMELNPNNFSENPELLQLGLQKNNIVLSRESPFIVSLSLRILNLSFCNISDVYSSTFKHIPNVNILVLHGNKIHVLSDEIFSSLKHLEVLDVSENSISKIDFASKLNVRCFYAVQNPLDDLSSVLAKFRSNVTIGFSRDVCCCRDEFCEKYVSKWISECRQCIRKNIAVVPTPITTSTGPVVSSTVLISENTEISTVSVNVYSKHEPPGITVVNANPASSNGLENKKQSQAANLTIILLSTIFSFLILVQSTIIVFLLVRSKRNITPNVYLAMPNRGIVVPSLIYGVKEQVTDLDDVSCSHLSLNPVYETIPE